MIPGRKSLVFEEGLQSAWLYETLSPHVDEIVVATITESRGPKSDKRDAYGLAEKLRMGNLDKPVFKAPREFTRLRELSRIHMTLVGDVVRVQARIKSLYRSRGVLVTGLDVYSPRRRDEWQKQLCSSAQTRATRLYDHLDFLREQKKQAEADLLREAKKQAHRPDPGDRTRPRTDPRSTNGPHRRHAPPLPNKATVGRYAAGGTPGLCHATRPKCAKGCAHELRKDDALTKTLLELQIVTSPTLPRHGPDAYTDSCDSYPVIAQSLGTFALRAGDVRNRRSLRRRRSHARERTRQAAADLAGDT